MTTTSFLPDFNNKTTSVADGLSRLINLITSFFAKCILKLGNEVRVLLSFILATEVVLLNKLGENEVIRNPKNYNKFKKL